MKSLHFSSIYVNGPYIGYFIDMSIQMATSVEFLVIVFTTAPLLVGIFVYMNGIVDDLRSQMQEINGRPQDAKRSNINRMDRTVVDAIRFHYKIIGQVADCSIASGREMQHSLIAVENSR